MFQSIIQHKFPQKDNNEVLKTLMQDIIITYDVILEHFSPQHAQVRANCVNQEVISSLFEKLELFKSKLQNINSIDYIESKIKNLKSIF